jgi:hypothetical protein
MVPAKVRPSLLWCLLGLPFGIAGLAGFVFFLVDGLGHMTDGLIQMEAPGGREFSFQGGKTYTVFLEARSVFGGKVYETTESIAGLDCRLTSAAGLEIPIRAPGANLSYSTSTRSGHSILAFTIPAGGTHTFACDYGYSNGPPVVLAVGSDFGARLGGTMAKAIGSMFAGGFLGAIVIAAVVVVHFRAKKRAAAQTV